jgi:hypothetical protein
MHVTENETVEAKFVFLRAEGLLFFEALQPAGSLCAKCPGHGAGISPRCGGGLGLVRAVVSVESPGCSPAHTFASARMSRDRLDLLGEEYFNYVAAQASAEGLQTLGNGNRWAVVLVSQNWTISSDRWRRNLKSSIC